jgi:hypothetical protein
MKFEFKDEILSVNDLEKEILLMDVEKCRSSIEDEIAWGKDQDDDDELDPSAYTLSDAVVSAVEESCRKFPDIDRGDYQEHFTRGILLLALDLDAAKAPCSDDDCDDLKWVET